MTKETADQATDALEGFLEDLPGTRADLPAEVEVTTTTAIQSPKVPQEDIADLLHSGRPFSIPKWLIHV